jgi:CRP-like cAMP-binding protein
LSVQVLLERSVWYPQLDDSVRAHVLAQTQECSIAPGAALSLHGDMALYWYGVLEGVLKWSTTTSNGRSVTLGGLTVGSWFGEGSLLHGRPVQADIIALRHSRVALIPKDTFAWLHRTQLPFSHFLLQQLNERLHWFMGDFTAHRLYHPEALVARALLGLQHPWLHPVSVRHLEITQEEIANLAGLSRQRCNQALSRLKQAGLVRVEYGEITLLDLVLLDRMACEGTRT